MNNDEFESDGYTDMTPAGTAQRGVIGTKRAAHFDTPNRLAKFLAQGRKVALVGSMVRVDLPAGLADWAKGRGSDPLPILILKSTQDPAIWIED